MSVTLIDDSLTEIERMFNLAGSIPIVAIVSGIVRATAGKVQAIAGLVLVGVGNAGQWFQPSNSVKWEQLTAQGVRHATHGVLNMAVGLGECVAGFTIVGSLVLLVYRTAHGFDPIYKYQPLDRKVVAQLS